jgi:hypothetical protein
MPFGPRGRHGPWHGPAGGFGEVPIFQEAALPAPPAAGAVRGFNGSTDTITFPPPVVGGAAYSFAALIHRNSVSASLSFFCGRETTVNVDAMGFNNNVWGVGNDSSIVSNSETVLDTDGWVIVVGSIPAGANPTPRLSLYNLGTATWTHQDASGSYLAPAASSTRFRVGFVSGLTSFEGAFTAGTIAYWSVALTDLEAESLAASLATQDWANLQPTALEYLADFNQASVATPVPDLSGKGLDQNAITGTTVITNDDPPGWTFGLASGGQTATVGQASETDTAQPAGRVKARAVGQATETDTAQPVGRVKARAVGQATETDTALAITRRKTKAVGQPSEADTALAITRRKTRAVGQPSETDTAQPVTHHKTKVLGEPAETDTALAVTRRKTKVVGEPAEADTALAITRRKTRAVGQAVETSIAQAITRLKRKVLGQATETDTALPLSHGTHATVGQASETDTALAITRRKTRAVGQAVETDTALTITRRKTRPLGQAVETSVAQLFRRLKRKLLGQGVETDTAQPITQLGPVATPMIDRPTRATIIARQATATVVDHQATAALTDAEKHLTVG